MVPIFDGSPRAWVRPREAYLEQRLSDTERLSADLADVMMLAALEEALLPDEFAYCEKSIVWYSYLLCSGAFQWSFHFAVVNCLMTLTGAPPLTSDFVYELADPDISELVRVVRGCLDFRRKEQEYRHQGWEIPADIAAAVVEARKKWK